MAEGQQAQGESGRLTMAIDRAVYWLTRHWLAVLNTIVAIYVGLPLLAPALMQAGFTGPARLIYTIYSPMCHQMASRSFFIFGEQYAYPRALAGTELTPIEAYLPELDILDDPSADATDLLTFQWLARQFRGNPQMGYKMALCERDMSIYGFLLLGGLAYGLLRKRYAIRPLPVWAFVVFGLLPIALDGFSQLLSQFGANFPPLSFLNVLFPLRESTPFLRAFTGGLLGLMLVWLTYPHIEAGMRGTEENLRQKLEQSGVQ